MRLWHNLTCTHEVALSVELAPPGVPQAGCADLVEAVIARDEPTGRVTLFMFPIHAADDPTPASGGNNNQTVSRRDSKQNLKGGLLPQGHPW
jgi:hypothetical protein